MYCLAMFIFLSVMCGNMKSQASFLCVVRFLATHFLLCEPLERSVLKITQKYKTERIFKMKKIYSLLVIVVMLFGLCACGADSNSKSDKENKPTSNEALEKCPEDKNGIHDWNAATCAEPAKCINCNLSKDDKLGNHSWDDATCTEPAECYICGEYKDDKLGSHDWIELTAGVRECLHCGMLYNDYITIMQNSSNQTTAQE